MKSILLAMTLLAGCTSGVCYKVDRIGLGINGNTKGTVGGEVHLLLKNTPCEEMRDEEEV